jgi:DNA ligase (NAD+)
LVHDIADLYTLQRDELLRLEGFAEKKVDNLLQSIEDSKNGPLVRLINGLGIRGVGEVMASDLAETFLDLDTLSHVSFEELITLEGVGPNIAQAIVDWFAQPANQIILSKLRKSGVWPRVDISLSEEGLPKHFDGKIFVISGTLEGFSRQEIKSFIEERGGKVTSSVSKKTSYLVLGENPGSKLDKAISLNIPLLKENELIELGSE